MDGTGMTSASAYIAEAREVSVIIPTIGRPTVGAAVASVLNQTQTPLEVIVVVDGPETAVPEELTQIDGPVRVCFTGGIGGNGARMYGFRKSQGNIVAFLDDDDSWLPRKLEEQLKIWREIAQGYRHVLLSCRVALVDGKRTRVKELPSRLIGERERVASYLFRRNSIWYGEGLLHTSTLMCDRGLIELQPWDQTLARHQDWDWVLRVAGHSDVRIGMCPDVLVEVAMADGRSVSMSRDWRASEDWLNKWASHLTRRERGDFLLCHTAPIAFRAGDQRGGWGVAWLAFRSGRPGAMAWLVWGLHMLSPSLVDRVSRLYSRVVPIRNRSIASHSSSGLTSDGPLGVGWD